MKLILIGLILIFLGIGWFIQSKNDNQPMTNNSIISSESSNYKNNMQISTDKGNYTYYVTEFSHTKALNLIDNLQSQLSAENLMQKYQCKIGFNGGFYDTNNKALGLLMIDGEIVSKYRSNALFNGFVFGNSNNKVIISDEYIQSTDIIHGSQTGPVLVKANTPITLVLNSDKEARRMFIADVENNNKAIVVGTVYTDNAVLDGPLLADLPKIVMAIGDKEKWKKVNIAINLDGGSASALITPEFKLEEWASVGSWWCIQ